MLCHIFREYMDNYHLERIHRGLDDQLIVPLRVTQYEVRVHRSSGSPMRGAELLRMSGGMNVSEFIIEYAAEVTAAKARPRFFGDRTHDQPRCGVRRRWS